MSSHTCRLPLNLWFALTLGVGVFWLDLYVELGVATAALYILVICVAYIAKMSRYVWLAAWICTALTVAGYLFSPVGGEPWKVLANRTLSLLIIWVTAILCSRVIALMDRRNALSLIVDSSEDAIIGKTLDGTITSWNQAAVNLYGYTSREMIGKSITTIVPADRPNEVSEILAQLRDGNRLDHFETVRVAKSGRRVEVSLTISPIHDASGHVIGASAIARDITERNRLAAVLHSQEEQISNLLNSTAEGIYGLDLAGNCTFANKACAKLLGYDSPREFLDQNMHSLIHHTRNDGTQYPKEQCHIYQAFRDGEEVHVDNEVLWKKDGTSFPAEYWSYPIRRDNELVGSVVTFLDITERKQLEEAQLGLQRDLELRVAEKTADLQGANESLEKSNEELQQFAYVASHDLKTPLRGIAGFAQFLQEDYQGKLDEQADDYISRIVAGTKRMQQLIDDLLVCSRVESRGQPLEPTDLNVAYDAAISLLEVEIEQTQARVSCDRLPHVRGDARQLSQLLQNLIGNAIKYRGDEPPEIHVSATQESDECIVSIRDNGIGIAKEHHERIFEIFRRLHTHEEYAGTGIGLAVCRRIVQRHLGRIWLESGPGEGSTFYVVLQNALNATEVSHQVLQADST